MMTSVMCPCIERGRRDGRGEKKGGSVVREESESRRGRGEALSLPGLQGSYCGQPCGGF